MQPQHWHSWIRFWTCQASKFKKGLEHNCRCVCNNIVQNSVIDICHQNFACPQPDSKMFNKLNLLITVCETRVPSLLSFDAYRSDSSANTDNDSSANRDNDSSANTDNDSSANTDNNSSANTKTWPPLLSSASWTQLCQAHFSPVVCSIVHTVLDHIDSLANANSTSNKVS